MEATQKWRAYYSTVGRIRMLGGNSALNFANTLHWRDSKLVDFVNDYCSLVDWAVPAMLITEREKKFLLSQAATKVVASSNIHSQWQDLRVALKLWLVNMQGCSGEALASHKRTLQYKNLSFKIIAISRTATLSELISSNVERPGDVPLTLPLLRSATVVWQLMEFPPIGIVRQCEADSCGGFFLDQSRAKPRRWCSMDGCGNREKAARHRRSASTTTL